MRKNQVIQKVFGVAVLFCVSLILVPLVRAYPMDGRGGKDKWDKGKWEERIKEMHKELGVTPEQEAKLKEFREKSKAQMESLRSQLKEKREAVRAELEKTDFNEAQVKAIHQELKNLMIQKEDMRLEGILQVRKILTPDQFKKFMEMKKEHKGFGSFKGGDRPWKHDQEEGEDREDDK